MFHHTAAINMFTSARNWLISTFFLLRFRLWEALPVWGRSTQKDWNKSFQIIRLPFNNSYPSVNWMSCIISFLFYFQTSSLQTSMWHGITRISVKNSFTVAWFFSLLIIFFFPLYSAVTVWKMITYTVHLWYALPI